ncbi:MAG: hypothetical protein ACSNEK_09655 [Parachlamydiaceae bacterium]
MYWIKKHLVSLGLFVGLAFASLTMVSASASSPNQDQLIARGGHGGGHGGGGHHGGWGHHGDWDRHHGDWDGHHHWNGDRGRYDGWGGGVYFGDYPSYYYGGYPYEYYYDSSYPYDPYYPYYNGYY